MDNLTALREQLAQQHIDAYLVPLGDRFGNEYVPASARRLEWLTGFSGSNGFAIITDSKAAFFTDGRYLIQAQNEVSQPWQQLDIYQETPADWLRHNIAKNQTIAFDGWLFTATDLEPFIALAEANQCDLVTLPNLIDELWHNQPSETRENSFIHQLKYAGQSIESKKELIAKALKEYAADSIILCDSCSINWLLNIRGGDLPHTPILNGYLLCHKRGDMELFCDVNKLGNIRDYLAENSIKATPLNQILNRMEKLDKQVILLDPKTTPLALCEPLDENNIIEINDPCLLAKACKNPTEQQGMRDCHVEDGAAVVTFLHWLSQQDQTDELAAIAKLAEFRMKGKDFHGLSFDTIAGFGANGAIIHYRADEKSNKIIRANGLLLLDSGGQYLNGTTDITRTIAIGTPTPDQRTQYSRVLKGHVALANARFPQGTSGAQLDALARAPLWQHGQDYAHGTGHGVGYMLNVHEGPQGVSSRATEALKQGMILSNEPGFYEAGEYGIRIESLVIVVKKSAGARGFYGFETITLAPFERALIDKSLLSRDEISWINDYHARVFEEVSPLLSSETRHWLATQTESL